MSRFLLLFLTFIIFGQEFSAQASEPSICQAEARAISTTAAEITAKYKPQFDRLSVQAENRSRKIKDDAPNPSTAGAVLKFDIKVTTRQQEFVFGLPSATMKTQSVSADLPEINYKRIGWRWDVPETRLERQCTPGPPETVCDTGALPSCDLRGCRGGRAPSCSLRAGKDICVDVPAFKMVTHEASMDVPEVTLKRKDFKFDLPEFRFVQQRLVLTIPEFTVVNVEAQTQKTKRDSETLAKEIQTESAAITARMKSETKGKIAEKIQAVFACNETSLAAQRDKILVDIDGQIASFTTKMNEARQQKNESIAASIENSIRALASSRESVLAEFKKAFESMRKSRDDALSDSIKGI